MPHDYFRRTGFRRQLTVIVTSAILAVALFSSLINSWESSRRMRVYLIGQGQQIAENLARQSVLALLYHSPDNAREVVATTLAFPDVLQVEITDAANTVVLSETKKAAILAPFQRPRLDPAPIHTRLEQETDDAWRFVAVVHDVQAAASPFELAERKPELLGHVRIVLSKDTMKRMVISLLIENLAITLSGAVILLGIMRLLTGRLIRPLHTLSGLMGRAEAGESGMRATPEGPRDIVEMALAFNQMMVVLEERQAELKQSRDQALHMALMKAQFAATVSHEVRTPLNGVIGMLDVLREMPLTPPQHDCVDVACRSAHTLMDLINNVLDFSKMEARKVELEEADFDLRKLLDEVIELLATQVQQKGLELGYLLAPGVPAWIRGDALRLRQVLLNLIGNAVKFTAHGEVAVRISGTTDGHERIVLRFEVTDTGIGMDQETARHVFESFAQADRSTTRKYGGTGLGLTISKQLVELMGGEIGVVSQQGKGTTFWLTILCKAGELRQLAPDQLALPGMRVLIMADSEIVRSFLTQSLAHHGMSCHAAGSGTEARQELGRAQQNRTPYALVIMDISADDGQAADLTHQIRSEAALSKTRILMLDRHGAPHSELPAGADGYLGKPLRLNRLLDAIGLVLPQRDQAIAATPPALPAVPATAGGTHRVLVVEDNRTNQQVAAGMLAMSGCHCEFAANGWEAIEAARLGRFDLILMDCNMPEVDGYEATAHIRNLEQPQGRRTPIIAMTANAQPGDVEKCLAAGMDDYLAKPIALETLRHKLASWLGKGATSEQALEEIPSLAAVEYSPLDRIVFDKLREILGPALQHAVMPFLEDVPIYLEQLEQAVGQGDAEAARGAAHTIKGCSGNLGATSLTLYAKAVEELALKQQLDDISQLLPQLRSAFDEVAVLLGSEVFLENQRPAKPEEASILVLVVDDDRSTRSALRHTLSRDGFRVEEAENGAQALLLLKRIQPDVILMDALMPVMDGFTTCTRIKSQNNGNSIPVLMITALDDNLSVERAFAVGASDYIPKPIHFAILSQRVRRIVDANRTEQRIRHLAYNDPLTDLPNRALFFRQLERCIEQARQSGDMVAVLFLDLDRFKNINDTFGHEVGDRLLVAVAQRIRCSVRNVDCVARLGGDEFTVVVADMSGPNAAAIVAQNISRSLSTHFQIDGHDIFISASIGISCYPNDGVDAGALLKYSDTAMYRAKKTRSGFKFFEAAMEFAVSEHMRLESDLREVLNRQELEVYYQPQARLDNGLVIGMEALLRWHHPTRGPVSPAEFIPVAEETGLINPIGEWVLRTACIQLQTWIKSGMPAMRMAVNLSVRQLLQEGFSATVEQVLKDSGLAPHLLELEITESTLMENAQDTLQALQSLRSLGVRLSIDDFGTGYSSLAYLKRFQVNTIKIDQSFVRDVPQDADDAAIIRGIIALAHSLRLEVVAEGVETEDQLRFLRDQSCDMMQGYLLSKPVPAQQFAQFIMTQTRLKQEGIRNADIS